MGRFKRKTFRYKVIQKQFLPHIPNEKRHLDRFSDKVESDIPTAYFAPEDYIHIYNNQFQNKTGLKKSPAILSDCPTALIAPEDYQHIYSQSKKTKSENLRQISETNIQAGPTVLIAPNDYVHIYKKLKCSSLTKTKTKSFIKKNINLNANRKKKSKTKLKKGKPVEMRIGMFPSDWNEPEYTSFFHESEQLLACYPFRSHGAKVKKPNINASKSAKQNMLVGPELPISKALYDKIKEHFIKSHSSARLTGSEMSLERQMLIMGKDSIHKMKKSESLSRKNSLMKKSLSKTKWKLKQKYYLKNQSSSKQMVMRMYSLPIEESRENENSSQHLQQLIDCFPYLPEHQISSNIKRNKEKNQTFSQTSSKNIALFHPNVPIVKSLFDVINL